MRKILNALVRGYQAVVAPHCDYQGTVTWWKSSGLGWISIGTVTRLPDGAQNSIPTVEDIYLHIAQCNGLKPADIIEGMQVTFTIKDDEKRGPGTYRAYNVSVYAPDGDGQEDVEELQSLEGDALAGSPLAQNGTDPQVRTPQPLKLLDGTTWEPPEELYREAVANKLLDGVDRSTCPRDQIEITAEQTREYLSRLLRDEFESRFGRYEPTYQINGPDNAFRERVNGDISGMKAKGMEDEARQTLSDFMHYEQMRNFLNRVWRAGMVRPNSVLPIRYLPDVLLAFPVLFFDFKKSEEEDEATASADENILDPRPHSLIEYLCSLLIPQHAKDFLQMFNLRARSVKIYQGDIIPAEVTALMTKAKRHFPIVMIATPYFGFAARDWGYEDAVSIKDPIVLGFHPQFPSVFFLLDRFSDAGFFPAYEEMVVCNLKFLRSAREHLKGLRWKHWIKQGGVERRGDHLHPIGEDLVRTVEQLLMASRLNKVSLWLRGQADVRPREMDRRYLA